MGFLPSILSLTGRTKRGKRKQLNKYHRHPKACDQEKLAVLSMLDETIEYVKSLQHEHQALQEAVKSLKIALADHLAALQCLQLPMGPATNHGIPFHNDRAAMPCHSRVPLFYSSSLAMAPSPLSSPVVLPWNQRTVVLPRHLTRPPHPQLDLQNRMPVMPRQSSPVAGNLPTWHQNCVQRPQAPNQEEGIN